MYSEMTFTLNGITYSGFVSPIGIEEIKVAEEDSSENNPIPLGTLLSMLDDEERIPPVWVKNLEFGYAEPAIIDFLHPYGLVAVWGAVNEAAWYKEETYGTEWLPYWDKPEEEDV